MVNESDWNAGNETEHHQHQEEHDQLNKVVLFVYVFFLLL